MSSALLHSPALKRAGCRGEGSKPSSQDCRGVGGCPAPRPTGVQEDSQQNGHRQAVQTARLTMGTVQRSFHQVTLAVIPMAFNEKGLGSWLVCLL